LWAESVDGFSDFQTVALTPLPRQYQTEFLHKALWTNGLRRFILSSDANIASQYDVHYLFGKGAQIMNVSPLWFAAAALLAGCGQHDGPAMPSPDAKLRSRLLGTWAIEERGATTLGPDGTFSSRWTNAYASPMAVWEYDGVWTVTGGVCFSAITNSQSWGTTNRVAEGKTDVFRILTLDERELVWESGGQTNSLTRKK
jgi:hypothetical protein